MGASAFLILNLEKKEKLSLKAGGKNGSNEKRDCSPFRDDRNLFRVKGLELV